ncbi:MAG: hypothetical protein WBG24_16320, partial [Syntrophobacteria bacterium]
RPGLRVDAERYPASLRSPKRARALMATGVALLPDRVRKRQRLMRHVFACLSRLFRNVARHSGDAVSVPTVGRLPFVILLLSFTSYLSTSLYVFGCEM